MEGTGDTVARWTIWVKVAGSTASTTVPSWSILATPNRMPVAVCTWGRACTCRARRGLRPPLPKDCESITKSPVTVLSMAALAEALIDWPATAKNTIESHADHQGGGGGRGALRVADGVLAGQAAGDAQGGQRGAEDPADGSGEAGPEHGHAHEDGEGARPDVGQAVARWR